MLVPLWQSDNHTQNSLVFKLNPNEIALLFATGFSRERIKTTATDMASRQFACLHRVLFDFDPDKVAALEPCNACDFLYKIDGVKVIDEVVTVNCCSVGVSQCSNTMLWALPGAYYFHLNDRTAVGVAQIWIDIFSPEELPLALLGEYTGVCHG